MVRRPDATAQLTPQNNQLMSKHRVLSFKPQLRLEWRGQDGQSETEQPDHSASLGDSITSSTRIRFSVHTGRAIRFCALSLLSRYLLQFVVNAIHREQDFAYRVLGRTQVSQVEARPPVAGSRLKALGVGLFMKPTLVSF